MREYNWATLGCGVIANELACAMEKAVSQDNDMYIQYTVDVMKIMTDIRKKWQMYYPEEEN